jgi:hypothetical protein
MRTALLAAVLAGLGLLPTGGSAAGPPMCRGGDLVGAFAAVRDSAGAGNIVYRLRVANHSARICYVTGLPRLQLVDRLHHALPTHVTAAHPGTATGAKIVLLRGEHATATARFSPDVPGPGEPTSGAQCEPTAHAIRFTPSAGGTLLAPVRPPTPVCEHGGLQVSLFTHAP